MKLLFPLLGVLLVLASPLSGQVTPLTEPLTDETETPITCELTVAPRKSDVPVFESQKEADGAKGVYHYNLWLPAGYSAEPGKSWPCMFIMSSGGNASMGAMGDYLKANGYIVVMLTEAKNGPWGPIVGNFLAAHDDVVKRARVQADGKYATGASGGARGSSVFVQLRPGFRGLILQAAGASFDESNNYNVRGIKSNAKLRVAMTMGDSDSNLPEVEKMDKLLSKQKFRAFPFTGGHTSAPAEVFVQAMEWVNEKRP